MKLFLIRDEVSIETLDALCQKQSLTLTQQEPWTDGVVYASWADEQTMVTLANDAHSGAQLLRIDEPDTRISDALCGALELDSVLAVLAEARAAQDCLDKVRSLYRAHALRLVAGEPDELLVALQCERLTDGDAWVRWAAARLLMHRADRGVEAALAQAAAQDPDLWGTHARVQALCIEAQDGTLHDAPTDAWHVLIERARGGLRDDQPVRAAQAMDVLLQDSSDHTEALLLRAKAYAGLGQPVLALALLGAAEASGRVERDAREGKGQIEIEALLRQVADAREELASSSIDSAQEARADNVQEARADNEMCERDDTALEKWLLRWAHDGRDIAACGAALAILERAPKFSAALCFLAGRHRQDRRLLERAHAQAPRSVWCLRALASLLKTDRPAQAAALYEKGLALLDDAEPGHEKERIDRIAEAFEASRMAGATSIEARLLEDLTSLHYDERQWAEAIVSADRLVVANPSSTTAWQWRANARTFAGRHDEAVGAYHDALKALDNAYEGDIIVVGSDPRPGLRFNLAGVLAELGEPELALDQLRRAVRGESKWGLEAQGDSCFESLWERQEFLGIVAGEAKALVLDEERQPGFAEDLVERAVASCQRGDYTTAIASAERATVLAEVAALPALLVRAVSIHARALASSGKADLGVAKAVKARALAEHEQVDAQQRSEIAHELGVVLHAAGNHERAADAYQRALTLRKNVYGEQHAIIAQSLSDIARLAADRGEPSHALYGEAVALLDAFLSSRTHTDEGRQARVDLAVVQSHHAESLRRSGDVERAFSAMKQCVSSIEQALTDGTPLEQTFVDHALNVCERLTRASHDSRRGQARELVVRLETTLAPGNPAERRERSFWLRLRRFVRNSAREGVAETTLARMLSEALRGGEKLPPALRRIPEVAGLAKALAERATRYPTLLAMALMALSTAEATGNLDEALENLQELCVAALIEGSATPPSRP